MKIHMKPLLSVCVNLPCEVSTHMVLDCFHITLVLFCWGAKIHYQNYSFHQVFPAYGHLDADNTFGHAAGMKSIDLAIPLAEEYGICAIAVSNSSHPGAIASFALRAARKGYIAFAFAHGMYSGNFE